jgi:hypothetical protein
MDAMDQAEVIRKIRGRVEQCRRLAKSTTDERTALVLIQMADEGEADINRMISEGQRSAT